MRFSTCTLAAGSEVERKSGSKVRWMNVLAQSLTGAQVEASNPESLLIVRSQVHLAVMVDQAKTNTIQPSNSAGHPHTGSALQGQPQRLRDFRAKNAKRCSGADAGSQVGRYQPP